MLLNQTLSTIGCESVAGDGFGSAAAADGNENDIVLGSVDDEEAAVAPAAAGVDDDDAADDDEADDDSAPGWTSGTSGRITGVETRSLCEHTPLVERLRCCFGSGAGGAPKSKRAAIARSASACAAAMADADDGVAWGAEDTVVAAGREDSAACGPIRMSQIGEKWDEIN